MQALRPVILFSFGNLGRGPLYSQALGLTSGPQLRSASPPERLASRQVSPKSKIQAQGVAVCGDLRLFLLPQSPGNNLGSPGKRRREDPNYKRGTKLQVPTRTTCETGTCKTFGWSCLARSTGKGLRAPRPPVAHWGTLSYSELRRPWLSHGFSGGRAGSYAAAHAQAQHFALIGFHAPRSAGHRSRFARRTGARDRPCYSAIRPR